MNIVNNINKNLYFHWKYTLLKMDIYTAKLYECIYAMFKDYCLCKKCGDYICNKIRYYPGRITNGFHVCGEVHTLKYSSEFAVNEWMDCHVMYEHEITPQGVVPSARSELIQILHQFVHVNDIPIFLCISFAFKWKLNQAHMPILTYISSLIGLFKECSNVQSSTFAKLLWMHCVVYPCQLNEQTFQRFQTIVIEEHNNNSCTLWHAWFLDGHEYTHFNQWLPRELVDIAMIIGCGISPPID